MTTEERITELEIRIAELERANEEMAQTATGLWKSLESMRQTVDRLTARLQAIEENAESETPATKPPHW